LLDRPKHGLIEIIQSSPVQTALEGFTYITARQSEAEVILIVADGVLDKHKPDVHCRVGERTLIMVRRALTTPKAA
jgi:hypothetical protein